MSLLIYYNNNGRLYITQNMVNKMKLLQKIAFLLLPFLFIACGGNESATNQENTNGVESQISQTNQTQSSFNNNDNAVNMPTLPNTTTKPTDSLEIK